MIIIRAQDRICLCDEWKCKGINKSNVDRAWKMWEVVFGVHPEIMPKIGRPAVVQLHNFHFCNKCRPWYETLISILIIKHTCLKLDNICSDPELHDNLGCWITIVDILGGPPPRNFQLDYDTFEPIYKDFRSQKIEIGFHQVFT